jgi:hypothetical protein
LIENLNREDHIRETTALNRRFEKKYFPKVEKAIKGQISSLIEVVESRGVDAGFHEANQIISSPVAPVIQSIYMEVGLRYARRTWRDLQEEKRLARPRRRVAGNAGKEYVNAEYLVKSAHALPGAAQLETKGIGLNSLWRQMIKKLLGEFLLEMTFDIAKTTRETLTRILQKSIDEGWGVDRTVKELEDLPLSRTQAARIVRTEVTRAANTGVNVAGETSEFEQTKEWISAKDHRTRGTDPEDHASHVLLNGITVDYDDVFIDPRNKDELRYPGDPKAKAESTINCRCSMVVRLKYGEDGRPIRK